MSLQAQPRRHLWIWYVWIGLFYTVWASLVFGLGWWETAREHWAIAVAMAVGSYGAGSTPMGGGTVGFPILVLLFDQPAELGRDFSFAVQSIGMVSAAIFIFARRQAIAGAMLRGAIIGVTLGLPPGIFLVAPSIPGLAIKLLFAVVWGSFGILHLRRIGEIAGHVGMTEFDEHWDHRVGLAVGFFASLLIVSASGVGVDMVLYTVLVLLCRADLKIAIPTSVIVMAYASALGIGLKAATGTVQEGVWENWLAAAPVVALGAPLGVFIVDKIGRKPTLLVVAALCVGQLVWTLVEEKEALGLAGTLLALAAVALCLLGFDRLRARGAILVEGRPRRNL